MTGTFILKRNKKFPLPASEPAVFGAQLECAGLLELTQHNCGPAVMTGTASYRTVMLKRNFRPVSETSLCCR